MKRLIAIADWAADSLACEEFRIATEGFLESDIIPDVSFVAAQASTVHVSFLSSHIVETVERYGAPLDTVIMAGTDPRLPVTATDETGRPGEFFILRLYSGLYVCGPNTGYTFSLLKSKIDRAFTYKLEDNFYQNRTRDLYSRIIAHLLEAMQDDLDLDEVHTSLIPQLDHDIVGHIDVFGNIFTNIPKEKVKKYEFNTEVPITLNGQIKKALYVEHLFAGEPGKLVVYPGKFGPPDNPFLEISIWQPLSEELGKTGMHEFNSPQPGMAITIE